MLVIYANAAEKLIDRYFLNKNNLGHIKEPKGVDFIVEPNVVTEEDRSIIGEAIAHYKATGQFKKVAKSKRTRHIAKNKVKNQ